MFENSEVANSFFKTNIICHDSSENMICSAVYTISAKGKGYLNNKHPRDHLFARKRSTAMYKNNMATGSLNILKINMEWIL